MEVMKKVSFTFMFILCTAFTMPLFAQDKAPVAEDDFSTAFALQPDTIRVLQNAYAFGGHPFKIFMASAPIVGKCSYNDSLVFYTASMYHRGIDSLYYYITDLVTGQMSEMATVRIAVENAGFDFLDINNVKCRINAWGNQFWDMDQSACFEIPANSGKNTIYSASLWLGGLDENNQLHLAGEKYRTYGEDYFPGPILHPSINTEDVNATWNRVWKLSRDEIDFHRMHWNEAKYEIPENILHWPANGNVLLGQAAQLAPFYDWNNDGIYNPVSGDFPVIKGDQAIYFIYNDAVAFHGETYGYPINAEIQVMFYAWDSPEETPLYNTIFADYSIINRSELMYKDFYAGYFVDFDLGNAADDYVGCDTTLDLAYVYNGGEIDGNGAAGEYGSHPPAQGITFLNQKMNSFSCFNQNGGYPVYEPFYAEGYYYYMQALWLDSTHLTYGGQGYGGDEPVMFAYPGNPSEGSAWSEFSAANQPGDRRCVMVTGPVDFYPGDTLHIEMAFVFARDPDGDNLSSVDLLKKRVADVRDVFFLAPGIDEPRPSSLEIKVYPNPFSDFIYIKTEKPGTHLHYAIYNLLGKEVKSGMFNSSCTINFEDTEPGFYLLKLSNGQQNITRKILKQ
jgi:hypothetical protein